MPPVLGAPGDLAPSGPGHPMGMMVATSLSSLYQEGPRSGQATLVVVHAAQPMPLAAAISVPKTNVLLVSPEVVAVGTVADASHMVAVTEEPPLVGV